MEGNSLFKEQDLSKLAILSVAQNVDALNTVQKFEALLSGYSGISQKEKDAMIHRVAGCLDAETDRDELWKKRLSELLAQRELLIEDFDADRTATINQFRRKAAEYGIETDNDFVEFKKMPGSAFASVEQFDSKADDLAMELRSRLKPVTLAHTRKLAEKDNMISLHNRRRGEQFFEAGSAANLIRKELDEPRNDESVLPPKGEKECEKMVDVLRKKTGGAQDANPLIPLTNVRGEPTMQMQLVSILYGLSLAGVQVQSYYQSLVLLNRVRQGFSNMYEGIDIGQKFMNSEVIKEIEHANALIAAGFSPLRWRAAFQKPIRGMVEQMLSEWERSGYKTLTLPQLHSLFLAPVGSSQAVTIVIPDEQREERDKAGKSKEDKVLEILKMVIKPTENEELEALLVEEDENAML
uniref:Uncharacterized protein n=1 Tax=viral metagenome TaxID=1070528 RepID=A0A2V0RBL3_9ZZZZ